MIARWARGTAPAVLLGLALTIPAAGQPAAAPEYAGSEMCGACHEEIGTNFGRNAHSRLSTWKSGRWKANECEACHGAGSQHAESADAALITGFARLSPSAINKNCLSCHSGEDTQHGRLTGAHDRNSLSCTSCHTVHAAKAPKLLASETNALCSGCHISARAAFKRPFRHKLDEGAVGCIDCHNPHGNPPPAQLVRVSNNEPGCLKCHADKRGPFPFEHAPVKLDSCATCHEPHGSANPRMLTRQSTAQQCLECHTTTMTRLGGSPPGFHDLRSARFQNCTVCHTKIHGSYVSRDLLR